MYQVNDIVRYSTSGVCKITEQVARVFNGEEKQYFVLRPIHDQRSTLFVPLDNEVLVAKMQAVLTKEAVLALINAIPSLHRPWIADDNERRAQFREALASDDRKQLIIVIKMIYEREQVLRNNGKKLRMDDEKILRAAEKLLYDEFSLVLEIAPDQVLAFIKESIS